MFFILFLMSCFCSYENINVQNYKYNAFLKGKLCFALFSICTITTVLHNNIQYMSVFSLRKY